MSKLTKKSLIKHLDKSDKEDIIREVLTLFDKFKNVKEFYTAELTDAANPMLERYKKKITIAYSSENPKERRTNLNVNKLIKEFKKISIYERELADLMLHRVECGIAAFSKNMNRSATFYKGYLILCRALCPASCGFRGLASCCPWIEAWRCRPAPCPYRWIPGPWKNRKNPKNPKNPIAELEGIHEERPNPK